jgi:hypothetical protein
LWITNNQNATVINFHQDFMAIMHIDFLKGQTERGLIYYQPNHSGETWLSKQEEGISASLQYQKEILHRISQAFFKWVYYYWLIMMFAFVRIWGLQQGCFK